MPPQALLLFLLLQQLACAFDFPPGAGRPRPLSFREATHIPQVRFASGRRAITQCDEGVLTSIARGLGVNPDMASLTSQQANQGLDVQGFLNLLMSSGSLDTASDLLTGFATSRLMGEFLGRQFDHGTGLKHWSMVPRNMWEGVCAAHDLSNVLDFDPQWAFCNIVNSMGSLLSCREAVRYGAGGPLTVAEEIPLFGKPTELTCPDLPDAAMLTDNSYSLSLRLMPYSSKLEEAATEGGRLQPTWGLSRTPAFLHELAGIEAPIYLALFLATKTELSTQRNHVGGSFAFGTESGVPGWVRELDFGARQEGEATLRANRAATIGSASLHRRRNPYYQDGDAAEEEEPFLCEFLLVAREPETEFDWKMAFSSQLDPLLPAPRNSKGLLVHRGVNAVADGVFVPLVAHLNQQVFGLAGGQEARCAVEETHVTLTGHSLGGAVAAALAVKLGVYYEERLGMSVVTFGAPRAFDAGGAAYYGRVANVRSVANAMDPLAEFPCRGVRGQKRCGMRKYLHLEGFGEDPTFAEYPNAVEFGLGELQGLWAQLRPASSENPLGLLNGLVQLTKLDLFRSDMYHCQLRRLGCQKSAACVFK